MTGVSYIVTVYNKAPYVPAVINAIFAQEGDFERELLIIDDGSTDESPTILDRMCAGRAGVRVIHQRNQGQVAATNTGARAATQPWLKIIDADDVLAPYATRVLLNAAARIDAKLAVGAMGFYDFGEPIVFDPYDPEKAAAHRRDLFAECLKHCPCNLSPTLIDRALYWETGGADPRLFYVIDTAVLTRLSHGRAVAGVDIVVAKGPREAPNRMSGNQRRMLMGHNEVMVHLLAETPDLSWRERHVLLERAFGRAWKWQRRRCGASLASRWFWLYALAKLAPPGMIEHLLPMTLDAFVEATQ